VVLCPVRSRTPVRLRTEERISRRQRASIAATDCSTA
jgi:hypothetical protein